MARMWLSIPYIQATTGLAVIEGGDFIGVKNWKSSLLTEGTSCVVASNNDIPGNPVGKLEIKGGRFSGKPYVLDTTPALYELPDGYVYEELEGQVDLLWKVVAE